jgi:glyoxylase-like metal-dependent hydrolase (beta-lactamase superfamily II)
VQPPFEATPDIAVLPFFHPVPGIGVLPVNTFVISAQEPVLVDTGMGLDTEPFMKGLRSVIDPRDLKWIWITHDDSDHVGSLQEVLEAAPDARLVSRLVTTQVRLKRLSDAEIDAYVASGEWRDKAGGYAIQGRAGGFVIALNGSPSNVVGLPLYETRALLAGLGYPIDAAREAP